MKFKRNYDVLHVHELEAALNSINESESLEEAAYIRKLISENGYKAPDGILIKSSEITSNYFKWFLIVFLSFLLISELLILLSSFNLILIVPVTITIFMITLIFRKSAYLKTAIKVWSALMILGAISGFIEAYNSSNDLISIAYMDPIVSLSLGLLIFWLSNKYIVIHEKISNKSN